MSTDFNKLAAKIMTGICIALTLLIVGIAATICSCGTHAPKVEKAHKNKKQEENIEAPYEVWYKEKGKLLSDVTGTSSVVLPDGSVRCYFNEGGSISYVESKDGKAFGEVVRTNIGSGNLSDAAENPINPAVLRMRSGRFLLLYTTGIGGTVSVAVSGGTKLNLAYSDDGKDFQVQGVVADLEQDANAVVNSTDVILLEDGTIRLYGAEKGISTAVSKDGGRTWITDGFKLVQDGVTDPDVHVKKDGTFVMYYSMTVDSKDAGKRGDKSAKGNLEKTYIRMAVSKNGLKWKLIEGNVVSPDEGRRAVFGPDYILLNDKIEIMYFCEPKTVGDRNKGEANLRIALKTKDY